MHRLLSKSCWRSQGQHLSLQWQQSQAMRRNWYLKGSTTSVRPPSSSTKASRWQMKICFYLSRAPPSSLSMIPKHPKEMKSWGTGRIECQIKLTVRRQKTRPPFRRSSWSLTNLSIKTSASRIACCNQSRQRWWVWGSSDWLRQKILRDARFLCPL